MHAIRFDRFGGPEVLQLVDEPMPEPGPGQVRVDLRAASVIPGDCKLRAGLLSAHFPVVLPKIPGRDGAGMVGQVGAGVRAFGIGDRVCVVAQHMEHGTYAQAIVRDLDSVVHLPDNLNFEQGAALMHAGVCAWICLIETARIRRGMRLLVHGGAGAIGGMVIQLARYAGAHIAATCRSENVGYVKSLGAVTVAAYDQEDFSQRFNDMDIVVDLIGGSVHERSYCVLKRGGHLVCLRALPIEDRSREFGVTVSIPHIHDRPEVLREITALASSGILVPQICDRLPLAQAAAAHRRIESGCVSRGRLVLQIGQEE